MSLVNATIRKATIADADAIGELAKEFQEYLRALGDRTQFAFTAGTYRRDGFGPHPAFSGLVAELDGEVAGYLLYHFGYDTDRAVRLMVVLDLYVQETKRRRGLGEALMKVAARICREAGGRELMWSVFIPNKLASRFYERLWGQVPARAEAHVLAGPLFISPESCCLTPGRSEGQAFILTSPRRPDP
jgi:L-amino acid N-acyltransferase YncA